MQNLKAILHRVLSVIWEQFHVQPQLSASPFLSFPLLTLMSCVKVSSSWAYTLVCDATCEGIFSLIWHTRLAVGTCLPLRRTVHTMHQMPKKVNEWECSCVHENKHRAREQIDGSYNGLGRWICSVVDVLANFWWDNLLFFHQLDSYIRKRDY